MADRRGIIVPLVILAFIFLSPDPVRPRHQFDPRPTIQQVIAEEQRSLALLQNASYEHDAFTQPNAAPLNLTGFEPERGYSWSPLPLVQSKTKTWLQYNTVGLGQEGQGQGPGHEGDGDTDVWRILNLEPSDALPLYKNVTGFVNGRWVRSILDPDLVTPPAVNLSDYAPENPFGGLKLVRPFARNITGDGGDIRVRFHERQAPAGEPMQIQQLNATQMSVEMTITDESTSEEHELRVFGVYFPTVGQALLSTTSDKFAGIFALPHFALSAPLFEESRRVLNDSIQRNIDRQISGETERYNPWPSTLEGQGENPFAQPTCELVVYLQQLAPSDYPYPSSTSNFLSILERELRFPTGAFMPQSPPLHFAMTAFSPDCGYMIESVGPPDHVPQDGNHLIGPKIEVLYVHGRHHVLAFTLVLATQLALLIRQMREASTPSTRSRISFYTIAMLCLGDGFATMTFMLISLFISGLWVNLVATAFLAFVSVSFFGMRFLMDIWNVQAPERERARREEMEELRRREERFQAALTRVEERRAERERAAAAETARTQTQTQTVEGEVSHPQAETHNTDTTPPETANTVQPPTDPAAGPIPNVPQPPPPSVPASQPVDTGASPLVFMPSDQASLLPVANPALTTTTGPIQLPRESFGALYTRFYLLLLLTLLLSLTAAAWPPPLRHIYFLTLGMAYTSFWLPQISRNVRRNSRHALNWEFVLGQSALRLVPFAYVYGYEGNVLFASRDLWSLALLATWLWAQVCVLASQEVLGARWFILRTWVDEAWEYHPVLRVDEEGGGLGMPVGMTGVDAIATERGKRVFDCAVCMQTLVVPVLEADGEGGEMLGGAQGLLARRQYMVTPCRHVFHAACLAGWMKYRLACPVCRENLPGL